MGHVVRSPRTPPERRRGGPSLNGAPAGEDPSGDPEVARLLRPRRPYDLPYADYEGGSIANLAASVLRWSGIPVPADSGVVPPLRPELDPFVELPSEASLVVLLIDGLGWFPLRRWAASGSERSARWNALARPISTVFPTTTTTALTSLSTGTGPATHGLVGYRQYLPKFGVVADLLKFSPVGVEMPGTLVGPNWRPELVSGAPSLFRRGVEAVALSRRQFEGTGFTRLLYDGAEYLPYGTATDLAHQLRRLLDRPKPPPVVYTYWDELDTIQHVHGPAQELVDLELERMAHLLEYVGRGVSPTRRRSTVVAITGDHGQVPATPEARVAVDQLPAVVAEMARPLAGDRRAGLFAARPGRLDELRDALQRALPEGSRILPVPELVASGIFGPPPHHAELAERLGDLLVLVLPPAGLTYLPPGGAPPERFLWGAHGGLDPEELIVPLVAAPLEEFG